MFIKMLQGPNAGEVRDISNDVAPDLIRLGRATRAFTDPEVAAPRLRADVQPAVAIEPVQGKHAKKGRK